jgi:hypothetical protein
MTHHNQTINRIAKGIKNFLNFLRNKMKNKTIASRARTTIHARDRVDRTRSQKNIIGKS